VPIQFALFKFKVLRERKKEEKIRQTKTPNAPPDLRQHHTLVKEREPREPGRKKKKRKGISGRSAAALAKKKEK